MLLFLLLFFDIWTELWICWGWNWAELQYYGEFQGSEANIINPLGSAGYLKEKVKQKVQPVLRNFFFCSVTYKKKTICKTCWNQAHSRRRSNSVYFTSQQLILQPTGSQTILTSPLKFIHYLLDLIWKPFQQGGNIFLSSVDVLLLISQSDHIHARSLK